MAHLYKTYADSAANRRQTRIDAIPLAEPVEDHNGSLLLEAIIAKPGIYLYEQDNGSTIRSLIPPDELLRSDSLRTLMSCPVTNEHPVDRDGNIIKVTPQNAKDFTVGHCRDLFDVVDGRPRFGVAITHQKGKHAIEVLGKREVSPCYDVMIERFDSLNPEHLRLQKIFGPFDEIQRNRIYNHLALTFKGRGGSECALRADAIQLQTKEDEEMNEEEETKALIMRILADLGITPKADQEEDPMADQEDMMADREDMMADREDQMKGDSTLIALRAENAMLKDQLAKIDKANTKKQHADSLHAYYIERKDVEAYAQKAKIEVKADSGIDIKDIKRQIVTHVNPNIEPSVLSDAAGLEAAYSFAKQSLDHEQRADAYGFFSNALANSNKQTMATKQTPTKKNPRSGRMGKRSKVK